MQVLCNSRQYVYIYVYVYIYIYIYAEAKDALTKAQMLQPLYAHTDFPTQMLNSFMCINIQAAHQNGGNDGTLQAATKLLNPSWLVPSSISSCCNPTPFVSI